ncbi:MAG: hypothetical protein CL930_09190 [Deltaproteobacteria bacterium]|nr:hypothetical protein [Deltaproteobacteria bacterium]
MKSVARWVRFPSLTAILEQKNMRVWILILLLLGVSPPVRAEATAVEFLAEHSQASEDGKTYLVGFLAGILAGYGWSNITLKTTGGEPLFCLNRMGEAEVEDPIQLLKKAMAKDIGAATLPVGAVLLSYLRRQYPCAVPKLEKSPTYTPPGL